MIKFFKKNRRVIVSLLALLVIILQLRTTRIEESQANFLDKGLLTIVAPIQSLSYKINRFLINLFHSYVYLVDVEKTNQDLIEQRIQVNNLLITFKELELKNSRLENLLLLEKNSTSKAIVAEVIGSDLNSATKSFRINKGSHHGLEKGMPVINNQGVVGHILRVSPFYSDVILITDTNAAVDATVQNSRARGVIKGLGNNLCEMKYLAASDKIEIGDVIITSGFGGYYPKGLSIGKVINVSKETYDGRLFIEVNPFVDLQAVEEVLVLQKPNFEELVHQVASRKESQDQNMEQLELKEYSR